MSDSLDQMTDAEIDEIFAEIAYGARCAKCGKFHDADNNLMETPKFSTDTAAVLPYLEKRKRWECSFGRIHGKLYRIYFPRETADPGDADTFARAACLAIIRAQRINPLSAD